MLTDGILSRSMLISCRRSLSSGNGTYTRCMRKRRSACVCVVGVASFARCFETKQSRGNAMSQKGPPTHTHASVHAHGGIRSTTTTTNLGESAAGGVVNVLRAVRGGHDHDAVVGIW